MEVTRAAEGRDEPSFSENREWTIFAHVFAQIVLAGLLTAGLLRLSDLHGRRFDLTTEKVHSLSDKTVQVLDELEGPIEIYSFIDPSKSGGGFTDVGVGEIREQLELLLWRMRDHSDRIKTEILDVHRQPERIQELQKELGIREENLVLVVFRDEGGVVHQKSLTLRDLAIANPDMWSGPHIGGFKGEETIVQAIRTVTAGEIVRICFTTGHGELDPAERTGLIKAYLENEAYTIDTIDLRQEREVPPDCRVLVVAGGDSAFEPAEVDAVRAHVQRGGSLFYLAEPEWTSGLEDVLDELGVVLGKGIVVCEERFFLQAQSGGATEIRGNFVPTLTLPTLDPRHPVTSKLAERRFRIELQFFRSIGRSGDDPTAQYTGLVSTFDDEETEQPESWVWTNWETERDTRKTGLGPEDRRGPVDVAVAVVKSFGDPNVPATPKARVVAVGDASFLEDSLIKAASNREFAYASLIWLAGRDPITLPPPEPKEWTVDMQQAENRGRMLYLLLFPTMVGMFGIIMWLWRRY